MSIFGCKEETPKPVIIDYHLVTIIWTGNPNLDGCGFFCKIDEIDYKPINEEFFGSEFKILKDTIVEMKYKDFIKEFTHQCPEGPPYQMRSLEVLDIK